MLEQAEQVAARLRRHGLRSATVTVKIRFGDFQTITRRTTLPQATDSTSEIWQAARALFDRWAESHYRPVRLIGVAAAGLSKPDGQLDLFGDPQAERQRRLDAAVDTINRRFGKGVIHRSPGRG
jgi:DNA polymerase-4